MPHLVTGGIEHVVLRLLQGLDRGRFVPLLFLRRETGELLAQLPNDVRRADADGRRALAMAPGLARWLRRERVDLVYSGTNAVNLATLMALRLMPARARPASIISEHTSAGAYLAGAKGAVARRAMIRLLYPRADLLMAPTAALCDDWTALVGRKAPPAVVARNPVLAQAELASLRKAPPLRVPGRVICAGRLIADKGHDVVLRAIAALAPEMPDLHLKIFGQGPEGDNLAALIRSLGLEGRARLEGTTPRLLHEMAQAQVVALGSRREGFGNVVIEGLAAGARLVATTCPGPRAILQDGRLGLLVPPDDLPAMIAALRQALSAAPDTEGRAAEIRRTVDAYAIPATVAAFEDQCEALLARLVPSRDQPSLASASQG
ncbi:MAG: glycosyltransferase [Paracoccaceae bacterium]